MIPTFPALWIAAGLAITGCGLVAWAVINRYARKES